MLFPQFLTLGGSGTRWGGVTGSIGGRGVWGLDVFVLSYTAHSVPSPPLQMTRGARQWKVRCVVLQAET